MIHRRRQKKVKVKFVNPYKTNNLKIKFREDTWLNEKYNQIKQRVKIRQNITPNNDFKKNQPVKIQTKSLYKKSPNYIIKNKNVKNNYQKNLDEIARNKKQSNRGGKFKIRPSSAYGRTRPTITKQQFLQVQQKHKFYTGQQKYDDFYQKVNNKKSQQEKMKIKRPKSNISKNTNNKLFQTFNQHKPKNERRSSIDLTNNSSNVNVKANFVTGTFSNSHLINQMNIKIQYFMKQKQKRKYKMQQEKNQEDIIKIAVKKKDDLLITSGQNKEYILKKPQYYGKLKLDFSSLKNNQKQQKPQKSSTSRTIRYNKQKYMHIPDPVQKINFLSKQMKPNVKQPQKNNFFKNQSITRPLKKHSGKIYNSLFRIQDYIQGEFIGKGAFAYCKIATNKYTQEKVVFKFYEKYKLLSRHKKKNLTREIELLTKFKHPNIIKLYTVIDTGKQVVLVMEFIGKTSLYQYLKSKPTKCIPEEEIKRIFRSIMLGVQYLHSKKIVHRDLKLENIMINENLNVKIIDFGFSLFTLKNRKLSLHCGTPSYMAPELVAKEDYLGQPVDIWALGILLFKMLTGAYPFTGKNQKELFQNILYGDFTIPESISYNAEKLLKQMLNPKPTRRPTAQQILQGEWLSLVKSNLIDELKQYALRK